MGKKPDSVWEVQCWDNRKVVLHRSTLKAHVLRFHLDSAFVVDALKRNLHQPICVIDNKKHGTVNAIYEIPSGGHPYLLVSIKFQKMMRKLARQPNFIKTFYGVTTIPEGPLLRGKRP